MVAARLCSRHPSHETLWDNYVQITQTTSWAREAFGQSLVLVIPIWAWLATTVSVWDFSASLYSYFIWITGWTGFTTLGRVGIRVVVRGTLLTLNIGADGPPSSARDCYLWSWGAFDAICTSDITIRQFYCLLVISANLSCIGLIDLYRGGHKLEQTKVSLRLNFIWFNFSVCWHSHSSFLSFGSTLTT